MRVKSRMLHHNEKEELGRRLAERRKALRVNQRELAELCGISEHALCNLERGVGHPMFDMIGEVLDALGLELTIAPKVLEGS